MGGYTGGVQRDVGVNRGCTEGCGCIYGVYREMWVYTWVVYRGMWVFNGGYTGGCRYL